MEVGSPILMNPIVKPVVAVVDDDPRIRESLESLIESAGFTAQVFALGEDFLQRENLTETKCSGWHGPTCPSSSLPRITTTSWNEAL
jgi:PleD family two-component response regulator